MNNAKAVTAARHLAATGVPWEDGTARCPLCGQRLHTISSGQQQARPRVRYHRCRNAACLMALLGLSIKSVEEA